MKNLSSNKVSITPIFYDDSKFTNKVKKINRGEIVFEVLI